MSKLKKYKLKTKASAKKRFKITGTGKVMRRSAGKRHLLEHVSSKSKRNREGDIEVSSADKKKLKMMMPGQIK